MTQTLYAIDPGCSSVLFGGHKCVRGDNHSGLHYDHDGYEWANGREVMPGDKTDGDNSPRDPGGVANS